MENFWTACLLLDVCLRLRVTLFTWGGRGADLIWTDLLCPGPSWAGLICYDLICPARLSAALPGSAQPNSALPSTAQLLSAWPLIFWPAHVPWLSRSLFGRSSIFSCFFLDFRRFYWDCPKKILNNFSKKKKKWRRFSRQIFEEVCKTLTGYFSLKTPLRWHGTYGTVGTVPARYIGTSSFILPLFLHSRLFLWAKMLRFSREKVRVRSTEFFFFF